jgi:uncharacterized protein
MDIIYGSSPLTQVSKSVTSSEPLRKKSAFGKNITGIEARILAKEARLKTLWASRLGHQMEALPEYDEVFRTLRRELHQAGFPE